MSKYRARTCPKCDFFLGFGITKHWSSRTQVVVTNFCLNCNYKLPVRSIVHGTRRPTRPARRHVLKLIRGNAGQPSGAANESKSALMERPITPTDYSRHLRVIGQDLENLQLETFNLECTGDAYLVWVRQDAAPAGQNPLLRISRNRLQKLWRNRPQPRPLAQPEHFKTSDAQIAQRLRYSIQDLDRIERDRRQLRRHRTGVTDGHAISQLLRTIGDLVEQRRERLLGVSWQELNISMVVETAAGKKEIDVFRPDNLYDLWVRMYLKRDNRAISDTPH
jgi:hypothetical protein